MKRWKINYWIDVLLILCLIFVSVTGLVLMFGFTSGEPGVGRNVSFMGTSKTIWLPWHNIFGFGMIILMFIHLILHWDFMRDQFKQLFIKEDEEESTKVKKIKEVGSNEKKN
jgi:cytochrome b subunit of formate dehydrogenase